MVLFARQDTIPASYAAARPCVCIPCCVCWHGQTHGEGAKHEKTGCACLHVQRCSVERLAANGLSCQSLCLLVLSLAPRQPLCMSLSAGALNANIGCDKSVLLKTISKPLQLPHMPLQSGRGFVMGNASMSHCR